MGARTAAGTASCGGSGSTRLHWRTGAKVSSSAPPLTMLGPGASGWGPAPPPLRLEGSRPAIGPPETILRREEDVFMRLVTGKWGGAVLCV